MSIKLRILSKLATTAEIMKDAILTKTCKSYENQRETYVSHWNYKRRTIEKNFIKNFSMRFASMPATQFGANISR